MIKCIEKAKADGHCIYNTFTFNMEDLSKFVRLAENMVHPYRVLACGERWSST